MAKHPLILMLAVAGCLLPGAWCGAKVTDASGPLQGTVRWSGEVDLAGPLTVLAGAALEIAPGTLIRVADADAILRVQGRLTIAGTEPAPVLIESPPGWGGIVAERPQAPLEIRHVRIAGAAVALSLDGAQGVLREVVFEQCAVAVRAVRDSRLRVARSRFADNGVGVELELKSRAEVTRTLFSGHREAALQAVNNCQASVSESTFRDNRKAVVVLQKFPGELRGNRFLGNDAALVLQRTGDGPLVQGNLFQDNDKGVQSSTFSRPALRDNRFVDNRTAVESDQFAAGEFLHNAFSGNDVALQNTRRAAPRVSHNVFRNNAVAIFCDYSSYPRVRDNNFTGNPLAVKLGAFQSAAGARPAGGEGDRSRMPPGMGPPSDLLVPEEAAVDFVDVRGNWWDEATAQLAAAGEAGNPAIFFDRNDRAGVEYSDKNGMGGRVDWVRYHPWLTSPVPAAGPR